MINTKTIGLALIVVSASANAELGGTVTMTGMNQTTACSDAKNQAQSKAEMNGVMEGRGTRKFHIVVSECQCERIAEKSTISQCAATWSLQFEDR